MSNPQSIERHGSSARMSSVVTYNGLAYLSGQVGGDGGDTIQAQTRAVLAKIDEHLESVGTSKERLLSAMIWLKDIDSDFAPMNAIWEEWVGADAKPARATVEAKLARPSLLIEIQVTAAL